MTRGTLFYYEDDNELPQPSKSEMVSEMPTA